MSRKNSNNKKKRPSQENVYKGKLDITRSGMGYVVVENLEKDILVRPNDFNTALHGDKVRVKVVSESGKSGRMQGVSCSTAAPVSVNPANSNCRLCQLKWPFTAVIAWSAS